MNIRRLVRRRTSPTAAVPVWAQPGHFSVGDEVWYADGYPVTVAYIDDDQRIGVYARSWLGAVTLEDNDLIRHAPGANCAPCDADNQRRAAEEARLDASHWDQWDIRERNVYQAIWADRQIVEMTVWPGPCHEDEPGYRHRFGPHSRVPAWMRTEFDGRLIDPTRTGYATLCLGTIWDPLDWLRLESAYADEGLSFRNPWGEELAWPTIRQALILLQDQQLDPVLNVDLEMRLSDDGAVGVEVWPFRMLVRGTVPDEIEQYVNQMLGRIPDSYPFSSLIRPGFPDRPGDNFDAPYEPYTYPYTTWVWDQ